MIEELPEPTTMTVEQFRLDPAGSLRLITASSPLVLTRDGRVRAYVFRDKTPLDIEYVESR